MIFFVRVFEYVCVCAAELRTWNWLKGAGMCCVGSGVDFVERRWPFGAGESGTVLHPSWWWWWWRPPVTRTWLYWSYNAIVYSPISSFEACFFLFYVLQGKQHAHWRKNGLCVSKPGRPMLHAFFLFCFGQFFGSGFWCAMSRLECLVDCNGNPVCAPAPYNWPHAQNPPGPPYGASTST